jgi:hypothetical protein
MKEKEGVYKRYAVLEDVGGENGRIHKNLANLDLDITKDVNVSYFIANNKNEHKTEKISFKEFQHRMLNEKEFIENVFIVYIEGENYGIELSGGEMWVFSKNMMTADFIYNQLVL